MNLKVSIVVPAYNCATTIKQCITSILDNDYPNYELIVVDDCSSDSTKDVINDISCNNLSLISNRNNSGASFSRNIGIKASCGDIILFVDADAYVPHDWIRKHVEAHCDINAGLIGGGIVGVYKTFAGKADSFCSWWTSIPNSGGRYIKSLHLPTNNLSVKKQVFDSIGYFNSHLRLGGEDAEFCHRALKRKIKIYLKSDILVHHYDRDDWKGYMRHQENWGIHAAEMRRGQNMDFSFLMPSTSVTAFLYVIPLAFLYTIFVVLKWVIYKPSVIICIPMIFAGKLKQTVAIWKSFNK